MASWQEIDALGRKYAETGEHRLLQEIVERTLPFFRKIARRTFYAYALERQNFDTVDDLVHAGVARFMKAFPNYDPELAAVNTFLKNEAEYAMKHYLKRQRGIPMYKYPAVARIVLRSSTPEEAVAGLMQEQGATVREAEVLYNLFRRRTESLEEHMGASFADAPEENIARSELQQLALEAIEKLSERERYILRTHYLEGAMLTSISKRLGITKQAVHEQRNRALKHLRSMEKIRKAA